MRLSFVLPTRLTVSALGLMVVAVTSLGAEEPQEGSENLAMAESVIAREEAAQLVSRAQYLRRRPLHAALS